LRAIEVQNPDVPAVRVGDVGNGMASHGRMLHAA
jgi:hypothetical protein